MRSLPWLFPVALLASGCADEELERAPTRLADRVQLGNREPGPSCRALEHVEVRSGRRDRPTSDALRAYAVERGANYIVVDTFSVFDEVEDSVVLTRARLFYCPVAFVAR
jgi:hypothetical protein